MVKVKVLSHFQIIGEQGYFTIKYYASLGFFWMPFYHTEKVPSIISLLFLLKGVWDYVKFILYIYEAVICFPPFIFLTWHISLIDFSNAKPTLHSWIKHHLVVMYYPYILPDLIDILLRNFASVFMMDIVL